MFKLRIIIILKIHDRMGVHAFLTSVCSVCFVAGISEPHVDARLHFSGSKWLRGSADPRCIVTVG